jgi:BMFP domain-containing protein YqiC
MCRHISDNQRLEHRLEKLEQQVRVNESAQDYFDKKMREKIDLLKEKIVKLELQLEINQVINEIEKSKVIE